MKHVVESHLFSERSVFFVERTIVGVVFGSEFPEYGKLFDGSDLDFSVLAVELLYDYL